MKKPSKAELKVLEALRDGKALERRSPLRINKARYWTLENMKISDVSPEACRNAGWIEAATVLDASPFARWSTPYTLTDLGRAALRKALSPFPAQPPKGESS